MDSPVDVASAHCKAKLCVISIRVAAVVLNTVACKDVSDWTGVTVFSLIGLLSNTYQRMNVLTGIYNTRLRFSNNALDEK